MRLGGRLLLRVVRALGPPVFELGSSVARTLKDRAAAVKNSYYLPLCSVLDPIAYHCQAEITIFPLTCRSMASKISDCTSERQILSLIEESVNFQMGARCTMGYREIFHQHGDMYWGTFSTKSSW